MNEVRMAVALESLFSTLSSWGACLTRRHAAWTLSGRFRLYWYEILCLLVLQPLLAGSAWSADLALGRPAPAIEAKLLDSPQTMRIAGASGKVTLVNFWATWCVPCREEMPAIQAYYDQHRHEGFEVLAISMDEPSKLAEVRRVAARYTFPVALKTEADFKGLGRVWRLPSTFVIDRQGLLRKNGHEGAPTVDGPALEALVTPLLAAPR